MNPKDFFNNIKSKKVKTSKDFLDEIDDSTRVLISKYHATGQKKAIRKMVFMLESIEKERQLLELGIDTFVYEDDVLEYINLISNDVIKIQELSEYERDIPSEIVPIIEKSKDIFDEMLVVFTDYTRELNEQANLENARIEKDPILFGVFYDEDTHSTIDRYYFLADWEDEYCDLTLSKMIEETSKKTNKNIENKIMDDKKIKELIDHINKEKKVNNIKEKKTNTAFSINKILINILIVVILIWIVTKW